MADTPQIAAMRRLGMTDEQIAETLAADKAIDRGERMSFDLSREDEKAALRAANAGKSRKQTVYDFSQRKRKENPTKASIIAEIAKFLIEMSENACENVTITNRERQIAFRIGENDYEFTLVQKRKPKN